MTFSSSIRTYYEIEHCWEGKNEDSIFWIGQSLNGKYYVFVGERKGSVKEFKTNYKTYKAARDFIKQYKFEGRMHSIF
ncbi:hypothetical protein [Gottfriedia acidiceleris]|uniref:hypothetical protein n=1 Tax=Gottfriedia acidiceleris TaxID=371036 RepID=UPI002FFFB8EF